MKLLLTLALLIPWTAQANDLVKIDELLAGYMVYDLNRNCRVERSFTEAGLSLKITGGEKRASTRERIFDQTPTINGSLHELTSQNYDGVMRAVLIEKPGSLLVILMWDDWEGGKDESSFCELSKL